MYNLSDKLPKQLSMLTFFLYDTCLYTPKTIPPYFFRLLALALLLMTLGHIIKSLNNMNLSNILSVNDHINLEVPTNLI